MSEDRTIGRDGAPLAATPTWRKVTERAHGRCECGGACGNGHSRSQGRCPRSLESGYRLYVVAPPGVTEMEAAAIKDIGLLNALCGECADGQRLRHTPPKRIRKTRTHVPPDQVGLFQAN